MTREATKAIVTDKAVKVIQPNETTEATEAGNANRVDVAIKANVDQCQ